MNLATMRRGLPALGAVVCLTAASVASAHFVWIDTQAKDGKILVKSGFGEHDGWDPDLIDNIKKTKYFIKTASGLEALSLPLDDVEKEHRATLAGSAPSTIVGTLEYGVVQFGPNPPSLLRYTAKHLAGDPKAWNDSATSSLRVELIAKFAGDHVDLQALHLGKPAARAKIKATLPDGSGVELTTDDAGQASWKLAGPGKYGCYVGVTTPETGTLGEKKYEALKDYTTLSFEIAK